MKTNMLKKKSLTKNSSFMLNFIQTFQSEMVLIVINTISGVILARFLGPEGRGEYITITMWSNLLLWYLHFNIYKTVIYYWKNIGEAKFDLIKTLFIVGMVLGCIACGIGEFVVLPYVLPNLSTNTILATRIFLLSVVIGIATEVIIGALAAEEKFLFSNIIRILYPLLSTIGMLILSLFHKLEVSSALFILFFVNTIIGITTIIYGYINKYLNGKFNIKLLYTLWYGVKAQGGVIASATGGNATTMILSIMLPSSSLGFFSTARSAIGPLSSISKALQKVSFPKLTGTETIVIHDRTMSLWRKSLLLNIITAIPFACSLPFLIPIIFGREYIPSIIPAVVLIVYSLVDGQTMLIANAINGMGKTLINTTTEVVSIIFTIIGLLLTLTYWGVLGACIVAVLNSLLKFSIYLFQYNKSVHNITINELFPRTIDYNFIVGGMKSIVTKMNGKIRVSYKSR